MQNRKLSDTQTNWNKYNTSRKLIEYDARELQTQQHWWMHFTPSSESEKRKSPVTMAQNSNLTSSTAPEIEHTTSRCPSYGDVLPNENKWPTSRKSVRSRLSVCAAVGVHFIVSLWDWSFRRPNQLFSSTCSSTFLFHLKFQSLQLRRWEGEISLPGSAVSEVPRNTNAIPGKQACAMNSSLAGESYDKVKVANRLD